MDISAAQTPFMAQLMASGPHHAKTPSSGNKRQDPAAMAAMDAAKQFESMIVGVMLEPMFSGIKADGPLGGGSSEKIFNSMLIQEYAKSITNSGGIGIADSVYSQMLKLQEVRK